MRNLGISAHIDCGKTTLTERILYYSGKIKEIHEVRGSSGGATMDHDEQERARGITIKSAATFIRWGGQHWNIIDTPGHVDFTIEVERSLKVMDGAVMLVCAVGGVQSQTQTVHRQMNRYEVPRVAFVNKMDRLGANPHHGMDQMREVLGLNAAFVQLPIGAENDFAGIVDVVQLKAFQFEGTKGEKVVEIPIPPAMEDEVVLFREVLIERVAEVDDQLAELFMEEKPITTEELKSAIRRATIKRDFVPVFVGSAYKNKGVQLLLDGVVDYLPAPEQRHHLAMKAKDESQQVLLTHDNKAPLVMQAFKIQYDSFGQLTWMRIFQGSCKKGDQIVNVRTGEKAKISRMVRMHAAKRETFEKAECGDVFGVMGIECASGDTFTLGEGLSMASMFIPEPVISAGIVPKTTGQLDNMLKILDQYTKEDPTFKFTVDPESGQAQISGMGELHLEVYCNRMQMENNVQATLSKPYVNYREVLTNRVSFNFLHKRQSGGAGQFARLIGYMEPLDFNDPVKFKFVDQTSGADLNPNYVKSAKKSFIECMKKGPLTGHPVWGVKIVIEDGQQHEVDSSDIAFQICAQRLFEDTWKNPSTRVSLVEPIMDVHVEAPYEHNAEVMTTVTDKEGATITDSKNVAPLSTVDFECPLSQMFGYVATLRQATKGKGEFSMDYIRHDEVPPQRQKQLLEEYGVVDTADDKGKGKKDSKQKKKK
eukprot:TRINITY_DN12915_c0_g1_i1.p1 TRINITY_DN12915_c0_g1~~TRINITY_DN12915_c0_g1_i1.p1  ORF type:complete len:747 (+),score=115.27 TRINITY_DN12915_c0_g1_i1:123-2243(+)